jgi:hypothetical protein
MLGPDVCILSQPVADYIAATLRPTDEVCRPILRTHKGTSPGGLFREEFVVAQEVYLWRLQEVLKGRDNLAVIQLLPEDLLLTLLFQMVDARNSFITVNKFFLLPVAKNESLSVLLTPTIVCVQLYLHRLVGTLKLKAAQFKGLVAFLSSPALNTFITQRTATLTENSSNHQFIIIIINYYYYIFIHLYFY